jgi:hypothetical protein
MSDIDRAIIERSTTQWITPAALADDRACASIVRMGLEQAAEMNCVLVLKVVQPLADETQGKLL